MKIIVPAFLLVTIAILGCALRYEVVQKNKIGAETAKSWQQYIIKMCVQDYKDLNRGDVEVVEQNLMENGNVYAKYYAKKFGDAKGTEFATRLSEGLALYDEWKKTHPYVAVSSTTNTDTLQVQREHDALGKPLDIKFIATDGKRVDLSRMKDKVVLVDFWATWCGPCVEEIPTIKKAYDQFHSRGFDVIGISLDSDKDTLNRFIQHEKLPWPQYFDGKGWQNKYAKQYGIAQIPTMWLVDKEGRLTDINARGDLKAKVEKLLGEPSAER